MQCLRNPAPALWSAQSWAPRKHRTTDGSHDLFVCSFGQPAFIFVGWPRLACGERGSQALPVTLAGAVGETNLLLCDGIGLALPTCPSFPHRPWSTWPPGSPCCPFLSFRYLSLILQTLVPEPNDLEERPKCLLNWKIHLHNGEDGRPEMFTSSHARRPLVLLRRGLSG